MSSSGWINKIGDVFEQVGQTIGIVEADDPPNKSSNQRINTPRSSIPMSMRSKPRNENVFDTIGNALGFNSKKTSPVVGMGPAWASRRSQRAQRPSSAHSTHRVRESELRELRDDARKFQHQKVVQEPRSQISTRSRQHRKKKRNVARTSTSATTTKRKTRARPHRRAHSRTRTRR